MVKEHIFIRTDQRNKVIMKKTRNKENSYIFTIHKEQRIECIKMIRG